MTGTGTYGWYGKVPALGDFTRAGLSAGFVQGWDAWMQHLLIAGCAALGERWQNAYMTAPIWRFACAPLVVGENAVAGVWMPSVDRVGRQFPLCVATEGDPGAWPDGWAAYCALAPSFPKLEAAALVMLEDGATTDRLAELLARLPDPEPAPTPRPHSVGTATVHTTRRPVSEAIAARALSAQSTIWVAEVMGQSRVLTAPALPDSPAEAEAFFDLDAACWHAHTAKVPA